MTCRLMTPNFRTFQPVVVRCKVWTDLQTTLSSLRTSLSVGTRPAWTKLMSTQLRVLQSEDMIRPELRAALLWKLINNSTQRISFVYFYSVIKFRHTRPSESVLSTHYVKILIELKINLNVAAGPTCFLWLSKHLGIVPINIIIGITPVWTDDRFI